MVHAVLWDRPGRASICFWALSRTQLRSRQQTRSLGRGGPSLAVASRSILGGCWRWVGARSCFVFFWLLCYVCSLQWTKILSTYGDLAISFDSFGHSHWRGPASRSEVQTLQRGLDRWPSGRGVPSRTWSMQQCLSSTFVFRIGLFFLAFFKSLAAIKNVSLVCRPVGAGLLALRAAAAALLFTNAFLFGSRTLCAWHWCEDESWDRWIERELDR